MSSLDWSLISILFSMLLSYSVCVTLECDSLYREVDKWRGIALAAKKENRDE